MSSLSKVSIIKFTLLVRKYSFTEEFIQFSRQKFQKTLWMCIKFFEQNFFLIFKDIYQFLLKWFCLSNQKNAIYQGFKITRHLGTESTVHCLSPMFSSLNDFPVFLLEPCSPVCILVHSSTRLWRFVSSLVRVAHSYYLHF